MDWQPIKTAPAVGKKKMLFWTKNGRVVVGHRFVRTDIVISQDNVSYTATHWMPLPSAPENFESGANAAANSPATEVSAAATRIATPEISYD